MPQLAAGCTAAVAGLLLPLLPSWALDSFAVTDTSIDPGLGDSPPLLDTLLVIVITYFTVMLLYLWLSSYIAGVSGQLAHQHLVLRRPECVLCAVVSGAQGLGVMGLSRHSFLLALRSLGQSPNSNWLQQASTLCSSMGYQHG